MAFPNGALGWAACVDVLFPGHAQLLMTITLSILHIQALNGRLCKSKLLSDSLKAPVTTNVSRFYGLMRCFRSLYNKQCGLRSDCSMIEGSFGHKK